MASRSQAKQLKEKTSQALIESALELCAEEGYASLSLRSVARKAGIAPTSFYRHFREIDEMGVAMIQQAEAVLKDWLATARKKMTLPLIKPTYGPEQILKSVEQLTRPFAESFADCFSDNPRLIHLFFQEHTGCAEPLRTAVTDAADGLIRSLTEILKQPGKALPCGAETTALMAETMITLVSRDLLESPFPPGAHSAEQAKNATKTTIRKLNLLFLGALMAERIQQG